MFLMLLYLRAVCVWVGSDCDGAFHVGSQGGVVGGGGGCGERGDSYCEIPVEGNWNSIGVRSWLLP